VRELRYMAAEPGMIWREPTFGLSPEEEDRYRTASLAADVAQARVVVPLVLAVTLVFAASDYAFLGLSWPFYGLAILRLSFAAGGALLLRHLRTLTSYRSYDRALLAWSSSLVFVLGVASAWPPPTFVAHTIVAAVAVLVTLLAIPNRFVYQLVVSAVMVAVDTVASVHSVSWSPQSALAAQLSIYAAGAVATVAAWQLQLHRRREFLHQEGEDAARASAESDLAERRRGEERLRTTLDSIADGFFACDEQWRFVYVNAPAERILAMARAELLGKVFWDVFPLTVGTNLEREYRRAAAGEVGEFENFYAPWGRWFLNRCFPREGGGMSVYFEDITERKRAEEELRRARQLSEALNRINEALHSTLDFAEINQRLVAEAVAAFGSDTAAISLREGGGWRVSSVHGMSPELVGARMTDDQERHAVLAIQTRRPVPVADAFNDGRLNHEHLLRHGVRSVLVAPLIVRDQPLGVIFFNHHRGPRAFTEAEVAFAGQVAATAAVAFENARLFDALRRSEAKIRAMFRSLAEGVVFLNTRGEVEEANEAAGRILGRTSPDSTEAAIVRPDGTPFPVDEQPALVALRTGAAVRDVEMGLPSPEGRLSWSLVNAQPAYDDHGTLLGAVASFVDISERKRAESRTALHATVTSILAESATLAEAAPRLLEQMGRQVGAIGGEVWLVDTATQRLRRLCAWEAPGAGLQEVVARGAALELAVGEGLPGRAWASRAPVWVPDVPTLPELPRRAAAARAGLRSLAFPITLGADELGVVVLAGVQAQAPDADLLQAAGAIGSQIGQFVQRAEAVRALDESRTDLDRAQEVGQIGWWRLDTRRNVLTWSDENHRIFGVAKGTPLTYESFLAIVHPEDRAYVDAKWNAGLRGEPYDIEHRLLVDGRVKWVREKAYLEFDDSGGLKGGFGITQDVTERKLAEEGLQQAKQELEQRVRERTTELAATVESLREEVGRRSRAQQALRERSNQLRRLAAELTLAEQREQRRLAELLHDELQQLLTAARFRTAMLAGSSEREEVRQTAELVQSLLDQSIEWSHSLTGELSPAVLHRRGLVAALEWLVPWMREKHGLAVTLDAEPGPSLASEDVALLVFRSVRELLFNTVKHAGVKEARLRLSHRNGNVEIEVSDQGAGFVPMPDDAMSKKGGFGLLSVRERIGLLGGRMEIDSAPGRGSRILLSVPAAAVTTLAPSGPSAPSPPAPATEEVPAARAPARARAARRAPDRIRVVVVDDHAVALQGLTDLLDAESDIEVVGQATDGEEAVEVVCRLAPNVVIMDVSMPHMDGIEATRLIKNALPNVRVIGLSMFEEGEQAEAIRRAGAEAYLAKSGPVSALFDAVRRWGAPGPAPGSARAQGGSPRRSSRRKPARP
jgi:PAS domain S-box-containing protein